MRINITPLGKVYDFASTQYRVETFTMHDGQGRMVRGQSYELSLDKGQLDNLIRTFRGLKAEVKVIRSVLIAVDGKKV